MQFQDIIKLIIAALMTPTENGRWGLPLLLEGDPGIAKTSVLKQVSMALQLSMETIIGGIYQPVDFLGMPIVTDENNVRYAPSPWAERLTWNERGLAYFDELGSAPETVQAAMLRTILEGVCGDLELPEGVRFIASQNAVEDSAGGYALNVALANRFGHVQMVKPTPREWRAYNSGTFTLKDINIVPIEERESDILARWPVAWAESLGAVAGFLDGRAGLLHDKPAVGDPRRSKAWPSPRSWTNATRALTSAKLHGFSDELTEVFMAAFVGEGPINEFSVWCTAADLPPTLELLDGKATFVPDPGRLDRTIAVFSSCQTMLLGGEANDPRLRNFWKILAEAGRTAPDITYDVASSLVNAGMDKYTEADAVLADLEFLARGAA